MSQLKTFVINLARSPDRKEAMTSAIKAIDFLELNFVNAIDGATLTDQALSHLYNQHKASQHLYRQMTLPEIGCSASHMRCYEAILATNSPYALILEDDVEIPDPTVFKDLTPFATQLDKEVPTIILCTPNLIVKTRQRRQLTDHITIAPYFSGVCAAGYLINRAAASHLLTHFYPVCCLADSWRLYNKTAMELWALRKPAISLNHPLSKQSTIEKHKFKPLNPKRRKTIKESLLGSLYRLQKKWGLALKLLEKIN